jgi:hypothetical protein
MRRPCSPINSKSFLELPESIAVTIGGLRKLHHRGRKQVGWVFTFTYARYDLVRMRTLIRAGVCA